MRSSSQQHPSFWRTQANGTDEKSVPAGALIMLVLILCAAVNIICPVICEAHHTVRPSVEAQYIAIFCVIGASREPPVPHLTSRWDSFLYGKNTFALINIKPNRHRCHGPMARNSKRRDIAPGRTSVYTQMKTSLHLTLTSANRLGIAQHTQI